MSNRAHAAADEELQLPDVPTVRKRIESCPRRDIRLALEFQYLACGRPSEVVARSSPSSKAKAWGPDGDDVRTELYRYKKEGGSWGEVEALVMSVKTAKRNGRVRLVGVPVRHEPWARDVLRNFPRFGKEPVFNFTRQLYYMRVRDYEVFRGLSYPIESYVSETGAVSGEGKPRREVIQRHPRDFALHALRHVRASELVEYYGFDPRELCAYGGWTFRTGGMPGVLDRYLSIGWQGYFPKMLRPIQR